MPTLLIVDDEPAIHEVIRATLAGLPVEIRSATTVAGGRAAFLSERPDVVILDVHLPDGTGLEAFRQLHTADRRVPVVFLTGSGATGTAIEAMAMGAYDYLLKPFPAAQLRQVISQALEVRRLMAVSPRVEEGDAAAGEPGDVLLGRCPAMHEVYKAIGKVAGTGATVLILGESGTGKELVARAIYHHSRRSAGPFLAVNCAAIPETLLESELFGHEKGAFTGADRQRVGKFEQCSGGTLFLDEVGDMAPLTQAKLLRVLQEQRFERVGGTETLATDVRVVAATNQDLDALAAAGRFRPDLFYRLNVYRIHVPPLRERGGDVELLVRHFLARFGRSLGKPVTGASADALALLRAYPWPGNVRELQGALQHAVLEATGPVIGPECLPPAVRASRPPAPAGGAAADLDRLIEERLGQGGENLYDEWLRAAESRLFRRVLRHTGGNLTRAAGLLGVHRTTLRSRLAALGLSAEDFAGGAPTGQ